MRTISCAFALRTCFWEISKMKTILKSLALLLLTVSILTAATGKPGEVTKSFKVSKGGKLVVDINPGDIIIKTWDKDELLVKTKGLEEDDKEYLELTQSGNTIKISFDSGWGWSEKLRFYVNLPKQFNVDCETSGGDIIFQNDLDGEVNLHTAGGDIELMNILGKSRINTSGGDITIGDVGADLRANTSGGDIETGNISGQAEIKTMGGSIDIEDVTSDLEVVTYGGDIRIGQIGGNANIETYGGDIRIKEVSGSVDANTYGGNINLKGASGEVEVSTAGGNLTLYDITGSVKAKTASGRIYAELDPSGKGRSSFVTASGEIKLILPETAKADIDATIKVTSGWRHRDKDFDYEIISDFKTEREDISDREIRAEFKLNGGGEKIKLRTTNSDIRIEKMK